jgi:hypothetical protein
MPSCRGRGHTWGRLARLGIGVAGSLAAIALSPAPGQAAGPAAPSTNIVVRTQGPASEPGGDSAWSGSTWSGSTWSGSTWSGSTWSSSPWGTLSSST